MKARRSTIKLVNGEDVLKILSEQAPVGACIIQDGKFCFVNSFFTSTTCYTADELVGKDALEIVIPEDREVVRKSNLRMLRGELLSPYQFRVTCKDGNIVWVMATVKSIEYHGRRALLGNYMEVTHRKEAEETVQTERNKLQSLVDAMQDGITIQDMDYNIIYQGRVQRSIVGDHLGEKCYRVYAGREKVCERCPVEKAFKDGKSHTAERSMVEPSGDISFWENTANPIRDASGEIVSCLEINRNITERKRQQQTLADELTQRRLLFDKSLDGIVILDVDARVVEANQHFADMLGYTLEEVRELHTWDWDKNFPPEQILEMGRNVDEKGLHLETKHTRKDGSVIDVDISISGIMYGGRKLIFCIQRDITDRNRAEETLKDNEESYRELANSITEVFFAMDEHLRYTYWNKASEILTGLRADDALGKSLAEVFPDSPGLRRAKKVYRAVLKTRKSRTFVNDFDIDGRHYTFEIGAYPSRGGISVFVRDITERTRIGEALRQSEEKYRTILEDMEDAYFEVDLGGHLTFVNNSVCRDLGYSREELMGMSYKNFTAEQHIESVFRVFNEVYQTGMPNKGFAWKTIRKDGVQGFAETSISLLRNNKGEIIGFRGVGRDVTGRIQAEEKLRQSEENYRALFDSSVIGTIVVDAETLKIVMANRAARQIFGFSSLKEVLGADPLHYIRPEDRERIAKLASDNLVGEDTQEIVELGAFTKDGRQIWISATGARIMHEGRLAGLISFTDITEQKRQDEQLAMADRLASIGELAAGTAHELNNPLASIIGLSELLMEKNTADYIRKDLAMIRDQARRAANTTSNLLTFARKHTPVKQLIQINAIIEDVLELRAYAHKSNCIDVDRHLASDLPEVQVDRFQMQQVFLNVVMNAEYFMIQAHKKGKLTITTQRQNGRLKVSFADDGQGIAREDLGRIFDPFFTTKEPGKGTGLGLSICHGIVAAHGGQIYAGSQPGKGATISVELPINGSSDVEAML